MIRYSSKTTPSEIVAPIHPKQFRNVIRIQVRTRSEHFNRIEDGQMLEFFEVHRRVKFYFDSRFNSFKLSLTQKPHMHDHFLEEFLLLVRVWFAVHDFEVELKTNPDRLLPFFEFD